MNKPDRASGSSSIVVIRGAADPASLRRHLPNHDVRVVDHLADLTPPVADAVAVLVARSGTRVDAHALSRLPNLRHVVRPGSGTDSLDRTALAACGVKVHRNAAASVDAVAEWALAASLSLSRRLPLGHQGIHAGLHLKHECLARPLSEYRGVVWGAGPTGRAVGRTLQPFVADLAYAAWPSTPPHLRQLPPAKCMAWADLHVVALPLRAATTRLFGLSFLAAVADKHPALVCVGRADTLDVSACVDALDVGTLSGLAIDPIEPDDLDLFTRVGPPRNLLLSPHVGAQRSDVRAALDEWVLTTTQALLVHGQTSRRGAA
ncbi:MAG: NAD(P)-dependent oxidoreductase [Dermatophilaceae bacterium]